MKDKHGQDCGVRWPAECLPQKHQAELEEQRATLQRSVEENMKQIEELSSRVKSLEGQLVETTNVANALGVTTQ